jgi:Homing endonuclease associated repeat
VTARNPWAATLTRARYDEVGAYYSSTLVRRLGRWAAACASAGVTTGRTDLGHGDDVWMKNIYDAWILIGHQPSYDDMRGGTSRFSPEGYARRYGSWTKALLAFEAWVEEADRHNDAVDHLGSPALSRSGTNGRTPSLRPRWKVLERDRLYLVFTGELARLARNG